MAPPIIDGELTRTAALGMAFRCASSTVPMMVPLTCWAAAVRPVKAQIMAPTHAIRLTHIDLPGTERP